jgi:uncharacterized protein (DUF433 family)
MYQIDTNALSAGIYTIPQVARLLDVKPWRVRGWVTGYYKMLGRPLIESDFQPIDHHIAVSFVNLIEIRFIAAFSRYGVSVRAIRYMAEEAKRFLRHPHPFATEMIFRTDGRGIFIEAAERTGDPKLYDLRGKNWGIHAILSDAMKNEVVYSDGGLAKAWYPKKNIAPDVVVHPKIAFGQPALDDSGIPTEALYDAYIAEGKNFTRVARWFGIPLKNVKEAIKFELQIRAVH